MATKALRRQRVYVVGAPHGLVFGSAFRAVAYVAGPERDKTKDLRRAAQLSTGRPLSLHRDGPANRRRARVITPRLLL